MQILKSATKLVLLGLTLVLAIITLYGAVIGIYRGTLDPSKVLEMFGSVMLFVTGYYFSKRETPEVNKRETPEVNKRETPEVNQG